jgi:nucleotide-binding universal stress UspA family protein
MGTAEELPILVGVDGSEPSLAAVRWAAAEGRRLGRPLRLVHSYLGPMLAAPMVTPPYAWLPDSLREDAEKLVQHAVGVARSAAPDVPVTSEVVSGPTGSLLVDMSGSAHLVVVGHRGHGGFASLLLGSVATALVAHAHCPTVVVRSAPDETGPVVVGVDGSAQSQAALEYAFAAADRRGVPLRVVYAWQPPPPPRRADVHYDPAEIETAHRHEVRSWVQPVHDKYPHVPVENFLIAGQPATSLVDAGRDASLLVIGSRGRGGFTGMLLGSVSQQVIHHASGAVAVIR